MKFMWTDAYTMWVTTETVSSTMKPCTSCGRRRRRASSRKRQRWLIWDRHIDMAIEYHSVFNAGYWGAVYHIAFRWFWQGSDRTPMSHVLSPLLSWPALHRPPHHRHHRVPVVPTQVFMVWYNIVSYLHYHRQQTYRASLDTISLATTSRRIRVYGTVQYVSIIHTPCHIKRGERFWGA